MIVLNGKKFAENEKEFTGSLFSPDGTCVGYAKRFRRRIYLTDIHKNRIGGVVNNVLFSAHKMDDGKFWYNYETPKILGEYNFRQETNDVRSLAVCVENGNYIYK